jgi:hypothetical protein
MTPFLDTSNEVDLFEAPAALIEGNAGMRLVIDAKSK